MFWFAVLPGPVGAVLYRFSSILFQKWGMRDSQFGDLFGRFAYRAHPADRAELCHHGQF